MFGKSKPVHWLDSARAKTDGKVSMDFSNVGLESSEFCFHCTPGLNCITVYLSAYLDGLKINLRTEYD